MTPTMMSQRDDEMSNLSVGVSYIVPGYNHSEFSSMLFYEEILGNYNAHENGISHLNTGDR